MVYRDIVLNILINPVYDAKKYCAIPIVLFDMC